ELFEKYVNYKDDYVIMASRGCVFSCSYCCESYVNKLYNNKYYRRRGVDSIMEELNVMKKRYGFREVMFNDALFFTDKKWLGGLLARYKKEIGVPFRCFGKINYFDEEIGRLLVDSGCYSIEFGMQTVNEPLKRKVLHRNETNKRALEVFKLCDKLKIRYDVDHMFGLPRETIDDHIAAVRFYRGLKYLNRVKCHNLTYFPNMEILGDAQREGLIDESDINNIKKGVVGDFFHCHSLKNNPCAGVNKSFNILLKILPLLSPAAVSWILAHKRYRALRFIPTFLVIPLQLVVALKSRDYRFIIYFKYYPLRVKRALFG
ncbi:MAG: radical SAM protein, partial [Candidatus Omnitrophota bacterium]